MSEHDPLASPSCWQKLDELRLCGSWRHQFTSLYSDGEMDRCGFQAQNVLRCMRLKITVDEKLRRHLLEQMSSDPKASAPDGVFRPKDTPSWS
mmetsp:Transcript_6191/g.20836  ORF Transcript_6191/g.20836 Transcript_6191/m.20836 type:complete len:93 (-) Transcript_6191:33-311(-)